MAVRNNGVAVHVPVLPRELPEVVTAPGVLADTPLLTDDSVDAVVIAVAPAVESEDGVQPRSGAAAIAARYGIDLGDLVERAGGRDFAGNAGQLLSVDLPKVHEGVAVHLPWSGLPGRLIILGVGDGSPHDLRRAGAALSRAVDGLDRVVSEATAEADSEGIRAFVEGYLLAAYRQPLATGEVQCRGGSPVARQLVILGPDVQSEIDAAALSARACWLARDLTNIPANVLDPSWFADRAKEFVEAAGITIDIRGPQELAAGGFGGILAVGAASESEPRLVTVEYDPGKARRHVVIAGKGITFDTGGLSIKPRASMVAMKTDMGGAAVALAAVLAAADAASPDKVTAVLPLVENHFGAAAYRPGDVVTTYGGTSVEIVNTDAEGRLVLADALAFAVDRLSPDVLIDVATLTGSASIGLGRGQGALFASDDDVAAGLLSSAESAGEGMWRLPVVEEYRRSLDSEIADIRQIAPDEDKADAIMAALFLREFTARTPWAHLDIAGPSRALKDKDELVEGATGFGTRTLVHFLTRRH